MKENTLYRGLRALAETLGAALFFFSLEAVLFEFLEVPFSSVFSFCILFLAAAGIRLVQEISKKVWQYLAGWVLVSAVVCGASLWRVLRGLRF